MFAAAITYYFVFVRTHVSDEAPAAKALTPDEGVAAFTDMEGNTLTLSDYFGTPLVVTSWASWCPQCVTDLPTLSELAASYDSEELKVLAVNRAENKFTAERFLNTLGNTENIIIILDPDDHFFEAHEGYAMPETLVYDRRGNLVLHQRGELRVDELQNKVEELISQ